MQLSTHPSDIRRFIASFQPTPAPVVVVVVTATPADTPTGTSTATAVPTLTPTGTNIPVLAVVQTSAATHTPTPTPTATLRPTFTPTVTKTATSTATGTATGTPTTTPTVTATAFVCGRVEMVLMGAGKKHRHCHTPTPTLGPGVAQAATPTHTFVPTNMSTPISAATPTPIPTNTPRAVIVPLHTNTPAPYATYTPTRIFVVPLLPTATPTIVILSTPVPLIPTIALLPTLAPVPTPVSGNTLPTSATITTVKPDIDISQLEDRTHELINAERSKRGLDPLEHISIVRRIARSHSEDMAARNYFAHRSPEGLSPTDRGRGAGYNCRKDYGTYYTYGLAENIHQGWLYDSYSTRNGRIVSYDWFTPEGLARTAVSGWMSSKGHRENILKPSYDKAGIGVAIAEDGKVYFTQNFC